MAVASQSEHVSVSDYLESVNQRMRELEARVLGEITEVTLYPGRSYLFFKIKDKDDAAIMSCFMWKNDYRMSGVELEVGLEVIISGFAEIYKPSGRFSFRAQAIEHVGEGKLKKAYDELKARLEKEGLFSLARKRPLPTLPQRVGLITSKDGDVIGDFQVNLGNFGFKVTFVDSRVEGQLAVAELLSAVRTMRGQDIEVLVLARGGGSLESLLPFNNEMLVREIATFPVPVIVGVGHEKNVPLVALAADRMVSTPTAAAQALNESWNKAVALVQLDQQKLFAYFERVLHARHVSVQRDFQFVRDQLQAIFDNFRTGVGALSRSTGVLQARISELRRHVEQQPVSLARGMTYLASRAREHVEDALLVPLQRMGEGFESAREDISITSTLRGFSRALTDVQQRVFSTGKLLITHDPARQLELGYSIVSSGGSVVRRTSQVKKGQTVAVRVQDGSFDSNVTEVHKKV